MVSLQKNRTNDITEASCDLPAFEPLGKRRAIVTIGPHVIDELVSDRQVRSGMAKRESCVQLVNGGSAVNTARQIKKLGAEVREVLFLGDDESWSLAKQLARREFPEAVSLRAMEHTRRSIWLGDDGHIVRSELKIHRVPIAARRLLKQALFVVVAPMTPADVSMVRDILALCPRCVLQLSSQQLRHRSTSRELAKEAWLVAVNESELALWAGTNNEEKAIDIVRRFGVQRLVVTTTRGVFGFVGDKTLNITGFPAKTVRQTRGAGDVFLASMLVGLRDGLVWPRAARFGLAAAALYVRGDRAHWGSHERLMAMIRNCP